MRVVLNVRLSASEPDEQGPDWAELKTECDLPFAPYFGLSLQFPVIETGHAASAEFQSLLRSFPAVTGVFVTEAALYNVRDASFYLTASEYHETAEEMRNAARQYVAGYGFQED